MLLNEVTFVQLDSTISLMETFLMHFKEINVKELH